MHNSVKQLRSKRFQARLSNRVNKQRLRQVPTLNEATARSQDSLLLFLACSLYWNKDSSRRKESLPLPIGKSPGGDLLRVVIVNHNHNRILFGSCNFEIMKIPFPFFEYLLTMRYRNMIKVILCKKKI